MYTVKQVAKLLDVNDDTVRRWIRNGELQSTIESKKSGHTISEEHLAEFMKRRTKYSKIGDVSIPVLHINDSSVALNETIKHLESTMFIIEREIERLKRIQKDLEL